MLIIAIPKSASSSLLTTLRELHAPNDTNASIGEIPYNKFRTPKGFKIIHKIHENVLEYDNETISKFVKSVGFTKLHIPPTDNNFSLLKGKKKIILLREPKEVVNAYYRAKEKSFIKKRFIEAVNSHKSMRTEKGWCAYAENSGLYKDLCLFYNGWLQSQDNNTLIIYYKNLISKTKKTINSVEAFFGLPLTEGAIELSRCKYTRG